MDEFVDWKVCLFDFLRKIYACHVCTYVCIHILHIYTVYLTKSFPRWWYLFTILILTPIWEGQNGIFHHFPGEKSSQVGGARCACTRGRTREEGSAGTRNHREDSAGAGAELMTLQGMILRDWWGKLIIFSVYVSYIFCICGVLYFQIFSVYLTIFLVSCIF